MKVVALIDHFAVGHHYAFIKLFSKYLLKIDYRLCICYPENETEIVSHLVAEGFPEENIFFHKLDIKDKKFSRFGKLNPVFSTIALWKDTRRELQKCEEQFTIKIDFVFFAWLDNYVVNGLSHWLVDLVFPYSWSGLYFHPWYLHENVGNRVSFSSIDSVLRSRNCVSVAIHDEFVAEKLERRIKKKVVVFPEIADSTPPNPDFWLASEIRAKAGRRWIIGLIGVLKRKGFLTFMELAQKANREKFFFFFAGNLETHDFSPEQEKIVRQFLLNDLPENCLYFPDSIPEGSHINAVIGVLDIIFIVYNNFRSSSNYSTKAALFKKQVLATNRFWIGRVTQKYKMGEVIEEGNIDQALVALDRLSDKLESGHMDFSGLDDYLKVHGEGTLEAAFKMALTYERAK
jgi:hypothetical protein